MTSFRVFYKGSYYRFSSVPISFAHLKKVMKKIWGESEEKMYYVVSSDHPESIKDESSFQSMLSQNSQEIIIYAEVPTPELLDYIDLQKSIHLNPDQAITELIRQELKSSMQLSLSTSSIIHHSAVCSNCSMSPIVGVLYSCRTCKIEFCENCEEIPDIHCHVLLKQRAPQPAPVIPAVPPQPAQINDKTFLSHIFKAARSLKELGFDDEILNKNALEFSGYNVDLAVEYIISNSK